MAFEMEDRLAELRGRGGEVEETAIQVENEEYGDSLDDCFTQVDMISKATSTIEELTEKLVPIRKTIRSSHGTQYDEAQERHAAIMHRIKDFNKKAINGLKRLDMEIKTANGGPDRNSAESRIKRAQYSTLTGNLKRVMMKCNSAEMDHGEHMKNLMRRRLKTTGSSTEFTEDQLEEMVESRENVFSQDLLVQITSKKEDDREITERKEEILKLEKNIQELYDMFFDLMLLVEDQDELVDNIETQVEKAGVYIFKGAQATATSARYKKSNRTMKWIICIVVSTIVGVLLIVIGGVAGAVVAIRSGD